MATMATTVASRDTRLSEVMQFLPAPAETNSDNSELLTVRLLQLILPHSIVLGTTKENKHVKYKVVNQILHSSQVRECRG